MTDALSREQIEKISPSDKEMVKLAIGVHPTKLKALCDMALRSLDVVAVREACVKACIGEYLEERTGTGEDIAYDKAIEHCIDAIRALDLGQINAENKP